MSEGGWIVALWAMLLPVVMTILLFVPPYVLSIFSLWNVHGDTILAGWNNVGYIIGGVEQLYQHWKSTPGLTVMDYFIPVFGPVMLGFMLSVFLMYQFYRYIRSVFVVQ